MKTDATTYLKKYVALRPGDASAQKNLVIFCMIRKTMPERLRVSSGDKADRVSREFTNNTLKWSCSAVQRKNREGPDRAIAAARRTRHVQRTRLVVPETGRVCKGRGSTRNRSSSIRKYSILSALALCLAKSGDVQQAIVTYEQALAMKPNASRNTKRLRPLSQQNKKTRPLPRIKNTRKDSSNGGWS